MVNILLSCCVGFTVELNHFISKLARLGKLCDGRHNPLCIRKKKWIREQRNTKLEKSFDWTRPESRQPTSFSKVGRLKVNFKIRFSVSSLAWSVVLSPQYSIYRLLIDPSEIGFLLFLLMRNDTDTEIKGKKNERFVKYRRSNVNINF